MRPKRSALLCAFVTCLSLTRTVWAAPTDASANQHFNRALALIEQGALGAAIEELEQAYALSPRYGVLYNLGQAYALAGRHVAAVDALRRYLSLGGDSIAPQRREDVERSIRLYEGLIGTLVVSTIPAEADVSVDGAPVEHDAALPVTAGRHGVVATLPGRAPVLETVEVHAGMTSTVRLALNADYCAVVPRSGRPGDGGGLAQRSGKQPFSAPTGLPPGPGEQAADFRPDRLWTYVTGGAGVAFGVLAGGLLVAQSRELAQWRSDRRALSHALASGVATPDQLTRAGELDQRAAGIQRTGDLAVAAALAGGALIAISITLLVTGADSRRAPQRHAVASGFELPSIGF